MPEFELECDGASVRVSSCGASLLGFQVGDQPILRPCAPAPARHPFECASFAMLPFVNRIAGGEFVIDGRTVRLPPNVAGERHPLHGQALLGEWQAVSANTERLTLSYEGGGNEWPWRYRAVQQFELSAHALRIRLTAANLEAHAAPMALGFHPYFNSPDRVRLEFSARNVWLTDDEALPRQLVPVPPGMQFALGEPLAERSLDHSFGGWDGVARMSWPGLAVELRCTHADWLHVYHVAGAACFCLEPQTAAPAALNRGGSEVHCLAPGETIAIELQLAVRQG